MADEKKYLEGNYDGEPVQQAVQMTVDVVRAVNMPEEIRAVQEAVYEKETERLSYEEKATGERFEELMRNYIEEDKYHQYLVDGAVLRCTAATTDDFTYAEGEKVVLENKDDQVCNITLDVHENPMSVNHLIYATVKDTVQQVNITPPKCNCRLAVNRNAERKRIADDMERNKNGVCRHLMDLNGTWDNFEVGNTAYLKKVNAIINLFPSEDGEGFVEGPGDIIGEEDGITMTSVLFCKHGGLIMPVTSGQDVEKISFTLQQLEISTNQIALSNTSIEPANVLRKYTQGKIQELCNREIIYFDPDGYQRVKNTGLESDPYLVAIGEYYSSSATSNGVGDCQGYGAIFKVTYTSGKEIYVTMGDLKDPIHTKTSMEQEGKNFYAGQGDSANTLEFICNYLNKNTKSHSENMTGSHGSDVNLGKAYTITEGASISEIDLLIGKEIEWEEYFEYEN